MLGNLKKIIFVVIVTTISSLYCISQTTVPSATVKNLSGIQVNTNTFSNDGKPFVIDFWATWCKPCIEELKNIHEVYEDWQKETGVKLYAISIDDSRNSKKVAPFVNGRQWKFEVMLDENSDFKRAMNVNNPPHTFLYNGKGELVWQHNGYAQGDENNLYDEIKKLVEKEKTGTENK
ncbi:MAG: TlpA family protein disulfide reductase [Bacteroidetes bacterium]|nr:MAG: TlpA family protein disulfide reductase [Bacteroidota bacterium]